MDEAAEVEVVVEREEAEPVAIRRDKATTAGTIGVAGRTVKTGILATAEVAAAEPVRTGWVAIMAEPSEGMISNSGLAVLRVVDVVEVADPDGPAEAQATAEVVVVAAGIKQEEERVLEGAVRLGRTRPHATQDTTSCELPDKLGRFSKRSPPLTPPPPVSHPVQSTAAALRVASP